MLRKNWGILALGLVGFGLFLLALLAGWRPLAAVGSVTAGVAGGWSLLRCQRLGILRTRHGLLHRRDHPAGFRFHLGCGWTAILLWTLGGVLFSLGVLGPR